MTFSLPIPLTQTDLDARLNYLVQTLKELIHDELGSYQLIKNTTIAATIPSIRVEPPILDTQFKMADKSGIECVISRNVDIKVEGMLTGGQAIYETYSVQLRQFDPNKSTQLAVFKILNANQFTIFDDPRTTPYAELSTGISYESTTIKIILANWLVRQ